MFLSCGPFSSIPKPDKDILSWAVYWALRTKEKNNFLVCKASEDPVFYMQARPDSDHTLVVEYRDGHVGRHFRRNGVGANEAIALFHSFVQQDNLWRTSGRWWDITDCFEALRSAEARKFRASFPPRAFER